MSIRSGKGSTWRLTSQPQWQAGRRPRARSPRRRPPPSGSGPGPAALMASKPNHTSRAPMSEARPAPASAATHRASWSTCLRLLASCCFRAAVDLMTGQRPSSCAGRPRRTSSGKAAPPLPATGRVGGLDACRDEGDARVQHVVPLGLDALGTRPVRAEDVRVEDVRPGR